MKLYPLIPIIAIHTGFVLSIDTTFTVGTKVVSTKLEHDETGTPPWSLASIATKTSDEDVAYNSTETTSAVVSDDVTDDGRQQKSYNEKVTERRRDYEEDQEAPMEAEPPIPPMEVELHPSKDKNIVQNMYNIKMAHSNLADAFIYTSGILLLAILIMGIIALGIVLSRLIHPASDYNENMQMPRPPAGSWMNWDQRPMYDMMQHERRDPRGFKEENLIVPPQYTPPHQD